MIKVKDAIAAARKLLGAAYDELDCINLIKKVIRTAPGGVPGYTTAGTNSLWDSYGMSSKYKDLTWRQESTKGARAGMLAFKVSGDNVHHVGLVTDIDTVIHSSSALGYVVETALDASWDALAAHRYIETEVDDMITAAAPAAALYKAQVGTQRDPLRVREWPQTGTIIGRVPKGAEVEVLADAGDGWPKIRYNELIGYVSGEYLQICSDSPGEETEEEAEIAAGAVIQTVIMDEAGNEFRPVGDWSVRIEVEIEGD